MPTYHILDWVRISGKGILHSGERRFAPEPDCADVVKDAYAHFGFTYPRFFKMDPLARLGWLGAEILLGGKPAEGNAAFRLAQVFQNAESSLSADRLYAQSMKDHPSPALFVYTLPNIVMGEIAIRHGLKGENTFFIAPAFDAVSLANYTGLLLQQGVADEVLCGWLDLDGDPDALLLRVGTGAEPDLPFHAAQLSMLYARI